MRGFSQTSSEKARHKYDFIHLKIIGQVNSLGYKMHLERKFESTKQTGAIRCYPADTQNGASGISFLRTKLLRTNQI